MEKVKILGIVGSPRKKGNTFLLVNKALEGAMSVPGVETEIYEMAGRKIHHCIGCFKCIETGECVFKDDLQSFANTYMQADGVIWGAPVYHMSIPASMKAALDRLGNVVCVGYAREGRDIPRFSKVCGVLSAGGDRFGGQELVLSFLIKSCLIMNGVVVSGDTMKGSYIGAPAWTGDPDYLGKENVLNDPKALIMAESVGKRVAEMTSIVRRGISSLKDQLPGEYFERPEIK
jgi:multimeric flavodoxin WrbA